ncbi:MAG TPA: choice-of-anchor tandem repeat GloVer-containing protein [Allosphingosinicella sp.]|nr:choice-of-anchor tandem repeat GloVer-containing protein [Allosphingosinicella sp.]
MILFWGAGDRAFAQCATPAASADRLANRLGAAVRKAALFLLLFLVAACGGGDSGSPGGGPVISVGGPPVLRSVTITPANPVAILATGLQLHATGTYSDGTTSDLTTSVFWESSSSLIAIVRADGALTPAAIGSATITASINGVSTSTTLTVQAAPVTLTTLHDFRPGDPGQPDVPGAFIQASDGNFYGAAQGGPNQCRQPNTFPCGSIFKVTPSGQVTLFHAFGTSPTDGFSPAGLTQGSDGALYGTTDNGGTFGGGTVFRIALDGTYSTLYSFGASPTDGVVPGALIQANDGNLYGLTSSGGANHCDNIPQAGPNCGTVFRLTPGGVETVLYSFGASPSDGSEPTALIQAKDGNFYGTTLNGGANACGDPADTHSCGTVFKLTPAGVETILHSFGASLTDGVGAQGAFFQGSDGAFYGATASGGGACTPVGCGTVFRITATGDETVLYAFRNLSSSDGNGPWSLIQGKDGNFYGTTSSGGAFCDSLCGTVFRLTPSGDETVLYSFGPLNDKPAHPGQLIQGRDDAFYGITAFSGGGITTTGFGTVYKLVLQ